MGKKKQKDAIRNNNQPSNTAPNAIDYEKLANCIAKAMAEENDKRINAYSETREWMKFIITPVFWIIAIVMGFFAVAFGFVGVTAFDKAISKTTLDIVGLCYGLVFVSLALMSSGVAITAGFAGKEFDKETDRQFVVAVFSGMVSLVALIVAFVALIRG